MSERYLVTRYLTENANMFRELSDEALESISEVHFADQVGAQGTFGVDLEPDFAEYVSKADNLLPVNGLMKISDYGLGAAVEVPEVFQPMEDLVADLPDEATPSERFYAVGEILDQGREGKCVSYSGTGWLRGGPMQSFKEQSVPQLESYANQLYDECQRKDEWPGEDYSGTSVTSCVKIFTERGLIAGGAETKDLATMVKFLLTTSSLMVASNWYEGQYRPNAQGFISATGEKVGGHAYRIVGVSRWGTLYMANSWSKDYGDNGIAYIAKSDAQWLATNGNLRGYAAVQTRR